MISKLIGILDFSSSTMMLRQQAELYSLVYPYAAEDFRSTADCTTTHTGLGTYIAAKEAEFASYKLLQNKNIISINKNLIQVYTTFNSHIHISPKGPTSTPKPISRPPMPIIPFTGLPPAIPPLPVNTVLPGAIVDNLVFNKAIPYAYISYIKINIFGFPNVAIPVLRRLKLANIQFTGPVYIGIR